MLNKGLELFIIYKIVKGLTTPWNQTDAYKYGIIDDKGNLLKKSYQLKTAAEQASYSLFTRFIFNLKRLLNKLPGGSTKLAGYLAVAYLLKEDQTEDDSKNKDTTVDAIFESFIFDETILKSGQYELLESAFDTEGNTVNKGDKLVVYESQQPFLNICGEQVYQLLSMSTGNIVIATQNALLEDGESGPPANNVGSGNIAGVGIGPQGEPGIPVKKKRKTGLFRRLAPKLL